jgi:hypothetical protein
MFALSDDGTSGDYTSSIGNIDVEWRRAMDDLQRQEEDEMLRGAYSEYLKANRLNTRNSVTYFQSYY